MGRALVASGWNSTQPQAIGVSKKRCQPAHVKIQAVLPSSCLFPYVRRLSPSPLPPWLQVDSPFKKLVLVIVPIFQRATRTRYGLGWWGMGRDKDLLPVLVFHSWVAGNIEDRDVLLELINLDFHILCQAPGCRHISEGLSQFIYCPPHIPYFLCNFFSIQ